jgi:hypothetical protein
MGEEALKKYFKEHKDEKIIEKKKDEKNETIQTELDQAEFI